MKCCEQVTNAKWLQHRFNLPPAALLPFRNPMFKRKIGIKTKIAYACKETNVSDYPAISIKALDSRDIGMFRTYQHGFRIASGILVFRAWLLAASTC